MSTYCVKIKSFHALILPELYGCELFVIKRLFAKCSRQKNLYLTCDTSSNRLWRWMSLSFTEFAITIKKCIESSNLQSAQLQWFYDRTALAKFLPTSFKYPSKIGTDILELGQQLRCITAVQILGSAGCSALCSSVLAESLPTQMWPQL